MAKKTTESTLSAGELAIEHLQEVGIRPMTAMGAAWIESMADLNREMIGFVADRIKEDVKVQQQLLHCKRPADFQKVQLAFFEKAYRQYTDQTGKLLKMSMELLPRASGGAKSTPL
ncbi:phasin family protein [Yoonia sediminilitoris]|uniref:Phasin protein n=1 Tax=Yoonia sediminilitoris TaxID=1286148 RepID=A0A2T6KIT9_9RHOB|nr:phasin family protein [Yoonia sediminilitoris]PUB15633.1 phasin protein [Yoonia sediminilitoris]RCW96242.1 phasin protein [Yoonia sediminilitoris]